MPYCTNCGNPVNEKDRFCPYCGTDRKAAARPAPAITDVKVEERPKAHKIPVKVQEKVPDPVPVESPEDRRRRVESSALPVLRRPTRPDKNAATYIWMLRGGFVLIAFMLLLIPQARVPSDPGTYMYAFVLVVMLVGAELINYRSKLSTSEARLDAEGITIRPVAVYPGIKTKERRISKGEITKVEIVRTRDAPPDQLRSLPQAGMATSLSIHKRDGKILSLTMREPKELLAAAEYAEAIWNVAGADVGKATALRSQDIYAEFANNHRSNRFKEAAIMMGGGGMAFIVMGLWMVLPDFKLIAILVSLIIFGMAGFMLFMLRKMYIQTHGVRSVKVERSGFELAFKGRTEFVPWSGLNMLIMARSDAVTKEKEQISAIKLDRKRSYILTMEIGEALAQAYRENTGQEAPNEWTQVERKGGYSANDVNTLKHENPALFKKNQFVSMALFANSLLLMLNVAIGNRLILLLGIVLLIILLFTRLQTTKEIREFMSRRQEKGP